MMVKKRITAALVGTLLLVGTVANAEVFNIQNEYIKVSEAQTELIPLRYAAEKCGYIVEWDDADNSVLLKNDKRNIKININDKLYYADGKTYTLEYAPKLIEDKTYVTTELVLDIFNDKYITKQDGEYCFEDKPVISSDEMMKTVREISGYPRSCYDATHTDAMNYVINKFKECGYTTEKQDFDFEYFDWEENGDKKASGSNIVAIKKADIDPTGDILIVGAHYDGEKGVPAANDNGSGLSVMLELVKTLKDLKTDTEIRFVAFDAEETGLNGSKAYVKTIADESENIIGMINFDMLGAAKAEKFGVYASDDRENMLFDILNSCSVFDDVKFRKNMTGGSDHFSFASQVIPNISFSHESILGEYHCENDIADNINPDNLKTAADSGYYIISTIMSNLTPSYKDKARPTLSETGNIKYETVIPTGSTREIAEEALGAKLLHIPSDDENTKYIAQVNLFDYDKTLSIVFEGQVGTDFVANPYIEFDAEVFDEIKSVLDKNIGEPVQKENRYFYNTIYGTCYMLGEDNHIGIYDYWDWEQEAYEVRDGKLFRMDDPYLTIGYDITKTNGKVNVTETKSQRSGEPVSEKMAQCWERLKPYLSEFDDINYIILKTDGLNNSSIYAIMENKPIKSTIKPNDDNSNDEIPEELKNLPEYIQNSAMEAANRINEGETVTVYTDNMPGNKLYVDYLDFLNEDGSCYTDEELLYEISLIKSGSIFEYRNMFDKNAVEPEKPSSFEKKTWRLKKDGYLYKFAEKFYKDIYSESVDDRDLYVEYPGEFVNKSAAEDIQNDIKNSFAAFVVKDKPAGNSVAEEKIRFFYDYPELMHIRENLRNR